MLLQGARELMRGIIDSRPHQDEEESANPADEYERERTREIVSLAPCRSEASHCGDKEKNGHHHGDTWNAKTVSTVRVANKSP
jgi:hypothetical protein